MHVSTLAVRYTAVGSGDACLSSSQPDARSLGTPTPNPNSAAVTTPKTA